MTNRWHEQGEYRHTHPIPPKVKGLRFACPSLEGLKAWFGEFMEGLLGEGYEVKEYDVEPEYQDAYQVGFSRNI
jgi:hypothetical protein